MFMSRVERTNAELPTSHHQLPTNVPNLQADSSGSTHNRTRERERERLREAISIVRGAKIISTRFGGCNIVREELANEHEKCCHLSHRYEMWRCRCFCAGRFIIFASCINGPGSTLQTGAYKAYA